jgi:glycerol-3-phosphate dehydrogenase (NAD(P)+)
MRFGRFAIVGAGAWGAALANLLARSGREVALWARDEAAASRMRESRESARLPGIQLDRRIEIASPHAHMRTPDAILMVVPAQVTRAVASSVADRVPPGTPVIACAKGIERGTGQFMTEVLASVLPNTKPAVLSGPSFATDVALGLPTAVTLAAHDAALAAALAQALGSACFRVYHSTDVRGVEIGGAAKNVLAIAAGIVKGRGLGASASAALTARGFAELMRFGKVYGARPETLTGLSGLGDLILTCASTQSRNFSHGIGLGEGRPAQQDDRHERVAEGAFTAAVLVDMAREKDVEMPIAEAVAAVLEGEQSVDMAVEKLLTRPFKAEGY